MNPKQLEQIKSELIKAQRVLIVFKHDPLGDSLCASIGLGLALKDMSKSVGVVSDEELNGKYSFLPGFSMVSGNIPDWGGRIALQINAEKDSLDEFWYEESDKGITLFIAPKEGMEFKSADVNASIEGADPDIVIAIGSENLSGLGGVYEKNARLFFEKTVIVIDNHAGNENYGQINAVSLSNIALSESVFQLLQSFDNYDLGADTATVILAGIIGRTNSFQSVKTTPRSFFTASQLVKMGADQQQIIRNLYKTRSFNHLKLWGRALARIKTHSEYGLVSTHVKSTDFERSGATTAEVRQVFQELTGLLSDARMILFLVETETENIEAHFCVRPPLEIQSLLKETGGRLLNDTQGKLIIRGKLLEEAENVMIDKIRGWLNAASEV